MPTGGKTPLAAGLEKGLNVIKATITKDKDSIPLLVLVTDGKANFSDKSNDPLADALNIAQKLAVEKIPSVVIDTEPGFIELGLAKKVANNMKGDYYHLDSVTAKGISNIIISSNRLD